MMTPKHCIRFAALAATLALTTLPAFARTKLVALPERASMMVNLERDGYTLVTEERALPLSQGLNRIDFAWQGVQIAPDSIQIEMLDTPETTRILNVTYPPNENALVWEIAAPTGAEERVRITYLLYGVIAGTQYRLTAEPDEKHADFLAEYLIGNQSGEALENARLDTIWPASFTRSIANGETRRLRALNVAKLPVKKVYRIDPNVQSPDAEQKYRSRMYYEFINNEASGLGNVMLPAGKHRIFQRDPSGSSIFVGEDNGKQLAALEEQRLFLGMANDVVVKRVNFTTERTNIRRNQGKRIVAYDEVVTMRYEIDNFKDEAVALTLTERITDYWTVGSLTGPGQPKATRKDSEEIELQFALPAKGEKLVFEFVYTRKNQIQ